MKYKIKEQYAVNPIGKEIIKEFTSLDAAKNWAAKNRIFANSSLCIENLHGTLICCNDGDEWQILKGVNKNGI